MTNKTNRSKQAASSTDLSSSSQAGTLQSDEAQALRQQAEKILRDKTQAPKNLEAMSPEETQLVLHELRVHQIELEMQNEELRRSQAELAVERGRYFDLYDLAPVGYVAINEQGQFLEANLTATTLLGEARRSLFNKSFFQFIFNDDQGIYFLHRKQLVDTDEPQSFELRMEKKDKTTSWTRVIATVTHDFNGTPEYRYVLIDINDRKQAEEALRESEAKLQLVNKELERRVEQRTRELQEAQQQFLHAEKLAAIGKLSASIAHEFNNPLQGILSILRGVKKRAILEEEDRELLGAAINEGNRIKDLIRSLQDFNRPSSGRQVMMDLHMSLNSLLLMYKSDFTGRRISVVLNYAENLPQIMAVSDQIKQVFLNLLANAADACGNRACMITISTWKEDDRVAVAIKDTGHGITPENIEQIFQPFFSTKSEVKGTGLGLSVSYGIVKKHHGEIRVESQPGEGTIFTVLLPIKGAEEIVSATDEQVV